jgi:hypothetical protein
MNAAIILAIISAISGTVFMTAFPFIMKKINKEELKFNVTYILTMLASGILSTLLMPLYFINSPFPTDNSVFICVATFGISAFINYIINTVIAYFINEISRLKLAANVTSPVSTNNTKKIITICAIVFLIFALTASSTFAAIMVSQTVTATGNIIATGNLGIFSDATGQTILTNIAFGNIAPSGSTTQSIYVKNSANYPMTLGIQATGFNPPAYSSALSVSWSYVAGTIIQPGQIVKVDVTLAATNQALYGSFSFNIAITGTQSG